MVNAINDAKTTWNSNSALRGEINKQYKDQKRNEFIDRETVKRYDTEELKNRIANAKKDYRESHGGSEDGFSDYSIRQDYHKEVRKLLEDDSSAMTNIQNEVDNLPPLSVTNWSTYDESEGVATTASTATYQQEILKMTQSDEYMKATAMEEYLKNRK